MFLEPMVQVCSIMDHELFQGYRGLLVQPGFFDSSPALNIKQAAAFSPSVHLQSFTFQVSSSECKFSLVKKNSGAMEMP